MPKRQSLFILPLSLIPPKILFWIVFPSASLAIPIRLEKNGDASLELPNWLNKSPLSIKNCLFSGREISKRVRLVTILSTSTLEKSGFIVTSRFRPFPIANFISPPADSEFCIFSLGFLEVKLLI